MASKNPFSLSLQNAQLQVKLLATQEELYELLIEEDYWPRIAETMCVYGHCDSVQQEIISDLSKRKAKRLANKIIRIRKQIHTLNQR